MWGIRISIAVGAVLALAAASAPAAGLTISGLRAELAGGAVSCREVVDAALGRIAASEAPGGINAVIEVNPEALEIADERDAERASGVPLGPLHCVPTLIKDNYQTADRMQTTAGSLTMRGFRARRDARVVSRWRRAGAVVVGKANMDEWAHGVSGYSSRGGQTLNGLNDLRIPGGSSGGSAAAVAAGLVPLATGSDTGGSIQIPASYNGIVGLRATRGLVSRRGVIPAAEVSDVAGPLVGSVADLAVVLGTMTGVDPRDPATEASRGHFHADYTPFLDSDGLAGARIGVVNRAFKTPLRPMSPEVAAGMAEAVATMRGAGATVVEDLPELTSRRAGWMTFFKVLAPQFPAELDTWLAGPGRAAPISSFAQMLARSSKPPLRSKVRVRKTLEQEAELPPPRGPRYRRAERKLRHLRRDTVAYMRRHDLDALLFPATGCPAAPLPGVVDPTYSCDGTSQPLEFGDNPGTIAPLLSPATGLPVLTLPGASLPGGMRAGLSLLGPAWAEPELIRLGYAFELAAAP